MKKRNTPQQELANHIKDMLSSFERWNFILKNGCNDPAWPDGCNMNLVRNHILYHKRKILDVCFSENIRIPEEYYMNTPQEVPNNFMSNLEQKDRVERLTAYGYIPDTNKPRHDATQLSIF